MVEQIILSPQVKRSLISTNKLLYTNCLYELLNDLKLRIIGNYELSGKSQNFIELLPSAQFFIQNENFISTSKSLLKNKNLTFPVVRHFT